jgi:hypothetical protein
MPYFRSAGGLVTAIPDDISYRRNGGQSFPASPSQAWFAVRGVLDPFP